MQPSFFGFSRVRPGMDFNQLQDAHIGVNLRRLKQGQWTLLDRNKLQMERSDSTPVKKTRGAKK